MNYAHNTPLYKMLRKVKKQLEKRETEDGCKQGMMFQVSKYFSRSLVGNFYKTLDTELDLT